jgi:hypothetical protein
MTRTLERFLAVAALLTLVFVASVAHAAGSFHLKSSQIQEVSGGWHIFVDIALPRPPSTPHMPMRFLFTKTVEYERALTDNSKDPVLNRQPLVNQTPAVESLDVDFSDPRGKIFNRTRFDFSLTRTRGYVAGEYKVQLRTSDGLEIGSAVTLVLNGDNPVVDRRAITFNANNASIKKVDNGVDGGQVAKNDTGDDTAAPASTDVSAAGSAPPFIPPDAYKKTSEEEIKTRPGGCGCSLPGLGKGESALVAMGSLAGLGLVAARRKRGKRP